MKKEYIYMILLIICLIGGFVAKILFINNVKRDIVKESKMLKEVQSQYLTDSLVQQNILKTVTFYEKNKDNKEPYGIRMGNILGILENILKASKIKYNENDLKPRAEIAKSGINNLYIIDLNFTTSYKVLLSFLSKIEKEKNIIDIVSMRINRKVQSGDSVLEKKITSKQSKKIRVDLVIQFLKFS